MRLRFIPPAKRELIAESRYYDRQLAGLGSAFLDEAEKLIALLKQFPMAGQDNETTGTRRLRMRRFPISFVYRVVEPELIVFAVVHAKRKPNYWVRRLEKYD